MRVTDPPQHKNSYTGGFWAVVVITAIFIFTGISNESNDETSSSSYKDPLPEVEIEQKPSVNGDSSLVERVVVK